MNFAWVRAASVGLAVLTLAACGRDPQVDAADSRANAEASAAFLVNNAKEPGVISLPSGLQYKVVTSGPAGSPSPDRNDLVRVDYEGTLIDGTVFDSSFEKGVPFATAPEDVVPGWTEALQKMKVGDEWILYVPPELGYKDQRSGRIPPNSVLVFRLRMLDMLPVAGSGGRGPGVANG
jgi:peptidylprolyl isomerase/FKBP-type peptidyl-prolyl cis-trans isomerase FklB